MSEGRIIPRESTYNVISYKILANSTDITNTYQLVSMTIDKQVNRVSTAKMIFRDGLASEETFQASSGNDLIPGVEIEIAAGFDGNDSTIFKGIIVKHGIKVRENGDSILMLDVRDAGVKLCVGRHSRYFTDATDSDAIEEIVGTYQGLDKDIESLSITHPEIVQHYSTDWDFILSRVEMNGHILLTDDGKLITKAPALADDPVLILTYGANILEFQAEIDARYQYKAVKAHAWNYTDQEMIEEEGAEPTDTGLGNLSGSDLADTIGLSELELRHTGQVKDVELKAWADAQMLKSRLAKVCGRLKLRGFPDIKPDTLVELAGMGARFNGKVYVSGVRQEIATGEWFTHVQIGLNPKWFYTTEHIVEKPAAGLLPGIQGLHNGVVVQLQEDPEGENRILVKCPVIDNQSEGIWARVATLDAGENRGSFFLPEIGDEVVLGFLNDDPRDPVVLGMLNSSAKPAPLEAADDNHLKGFVTRSEMKVIFDDEKSIITMETPGGQKITISDEDKGIKLEDQTGNTLTLNDSGIELNSPKDIKLTATGKIELKASQDLSAEGLNVNAKANAQFKAEGSAGAELSTSAIATVKGSVVMIN